MTDIKNDVEPKEVSTTPLTGWARIWGIMKKWGVTGILGTILASGSTWTVTTMDTLKDENIVMKQRLKDNKIHREAMWLRLYYFTDVQQKTQVQVEVNKQLYNILVYSKKIDVKDLAKAYTTQLELNSKLPKPTNSKTLDNFKIDSLKQVQAPQSIK